MLLKIEKYLKKNCKKEGRTVYYPVNQKRVTLKIFFT